MGLESATYIDSLNTANPLGTDVKSAGDDHLRLIKSTIKATFPGMAGAAWRVQTKSSSPYTVLATDNMSMIRCSTAVTLNLTAAATLGNQHMFVAYADGGIVTIDPNGAETINGAATLSVPDGTAVLVVCNASAFFALFMFETSDITSLVSAATTTLAGKVELLIQAELNTGTDNTRAPTADILLAWAPAFPTVSVATSDKVVITDATDSNKLKLVAESEFARAQHYIAIEDQKADGTAGDAFTTGAWTKFTLNTEVLDSGNNASIASSVVTLEAGTYELHAMAVRAQQTNLRMRFYNTADAAVLVGPSLVWQVGSPATTNSVLPCLMFGRFTLAAQKTCELQYYTTVATASYADVTGDGGVEVYTGLYLRRVA